MSAVKELALMPVQPVDSGDRMLAMIERLAQLDNFDVEKLQRLIDMKNDADAARARSEFSAAFSKMQPNIPEVSEKGQILVKGVLRSTYAKLEDIHEAIKPILSEYGFSLRHRTEWPADKPGIIRIVGILGHVGGHSEESCFEAKADSSDYRTDIQSQGSTVSYGRRYTTIDLVNIVTRGQDNDGRNKKEPEEVKAPEGFENWLADLETIVGDGCDWPTLQKAWNDSKEEFRAHISKTNRPKVEGWRNAAKAVSAKAVTRG